MEKQNRRLPRILLIILAAALAASLGWDWYDKNVDRSGWVETEEGASYLDFYGEPLTGWQEIDGKHYYFSGDGLARKGWMKLNGQLYYFLEDGSRASSWQEIDGSRYYFTADGIPASGWQESDGVRFYLNEDGTPASGWHAEEEITYYLSANGVPSIGWINIEGNLYYFDETGNRHTGWLDLDGSRYYLHADGIMAVGLTQIDGQTYIFRADGTMATGWVTQGQYTYYLKEDGTPVTGPQEIDGKKYYFSPHGVHIVLVNAWNYLPDDLSLDLMELYDDIQVDMKCYDALMEMLDDCADAGYSPYVCSGYRTQAKQEWLFENRIYRYEQEGYSREEAEELAPKSVAIPGTSEHQLGLAVDIISDESAILTDVQASTQTQQWLMEHCWEYGFILRYPESATDITGIIYEPWHYRYVGVEISMEMKELGITLEEYLGATDHLQ